MASGIIFRQGEPFDSFFADLMQAILTGGEPAVGDVVSAPHALGLAFQASVSIASSSVSHLLIGNPSLDAKKDAPS